MAKKRKNAMTKYREPTVEVPEKWKLLTDEEFALYYQYKEEQFKTLLKKDYSKYVEEVNGNNFIMGKHIKFTCDIVQLFLENRLKSQNDPDTPAEVLLVSFPPQHGKLCSNDTNVLTVSGWKNHGDLMPGDYVFGPDGKPKEVLAEFNHGQSEYAVGFTDGSVIETHGNHEWVVYDRKSHTKKTLTTKEMHDTDYYEGNRSRYQVDANTCVEFSAKDLALEPYVLGLWLGDGTTTKPCITHHKNDMPYIEKVKSYGYEISNVFIHKKTGVHTTVFNDLIPKLKEIGFLNGEEKHIPTRYKLGSKEQRLELLAGLIDSDGYVYQKNGRVTFSNTNKQLIDDVEELCISLGFRTTVSEFEPKKSSSGIIGKKTVYQLTFNPDMNIPTALERKKTTKINPMKRKRGIKSIKLTEKKDGKCIQVEGGVYLVGKKLIPTHNSWSITETLPSWFVGFNPDKRVIIVSYGDDLARRFGRNNKLKAVEQQENLFLNLELLRDSDTDIYTDKKGSILSRGIGGGVTGQSADLIIVDDPIKNKKEANSQNIRDAIYSEYRDSLLSRLSSSGKAIVIMTRWHEDDLIGKIMSMKNQSYFCLNLPCEAEENDLLGRAVGEPLFPEIGKDKKWLEKMKRTYSDKEGIRSWLALYQGRPTAQEGNMFKRHYWRFYDPQLDMPTYFDEIIQSWDCAFKDEDDHDFVCGTVWGRQAANYYLLDLVNEKMDIIYTMRGIENMSNKWPKALVKLVEDKANGPAVIRLLRNKIAGLVPVTPDGGKVARANAVLGAVESGNVFLPIPELYPWVLDYIEQMASFPNGANDDMVDSTTQALNRLIYNSNTKPPEVEKTVIQRHKEKLYKRQKKGNRAAMY